MKTFYSEVRENSQTRKKKFEFFNENALFVLFFSLLLVLILVIVYWKWIILPPFFQFELKKSNFSIALKTVVEMYCSSRSCEETSRKRYNNKQQKQISTLRTKSYESYQTVNRKYRAMIGLFAKARKVGVSEFQVTNWVFLRARPRKPIF